MLSTTNRGVLSEVQGCSGFAGCAPSSAPAHIDSGVDGQVTCVWFFNGTHAHFAGPVLHLAVGVLAVLYD